MRKPLVLTIRCLMGRARAASRISKKGVQRGLAARDLHHVGFALAGDDGVEHGDDVFKAAVRGALGAGARIAGGAAQIAVVADLDDGQAAVLHVVGAQAAVVGQPYCIGVAKRAGISGGLT